MIVIVDYNSEWPILFEQEQKLLIEQIGDWLESIEHIGSTSVPGLAAKPIIDILMGVCSLADVNMHCIKPLQLLGYEYVPEFEVELSERRYFRKHTATGERTHNLHVVEINSAFWQRHIAFRNYLRTHPETVIAYAELKRKLAAVHTDIYQYADAKTAFIKDIEKKALKLFS